jgi:hypothetical protein
MNSDHEAAFLAGVRTYISGRQTTLLTHGQTPHMLYKMGGEPGVEPEFWRPEMWAQTMDVQKSSFSGVVQCVHVISQYKNFLELP